MRVAAINGLSFDAGCSTHNRNWNGLTGRVSYSRVIAVYGCADTATSGTAGELALSLRRGGNTISSERATSWVRELVPPADLPTPRTWQLKPPLRDFRCAAPHPYYRVPSSSENLRRTSNDGINHEARSAIYASVPIPNLINGVSFNTYCAFAVVASSSSHPVTTTLTGTKYGAIGNNPPRQEGEPETRRCYVALTCMWESGGTAFDSAVGDRVYVSGTHDIVTSGDTLRIRTSGGAGTVREALAYYPLPN